MHGCWGGCREVPRGNKLDGSRFAKNREGKMNGGLLEVDDEGSVPARAAWPWAVFTGALIAGIVLFFVYPPR